MPEMRLLYITDPHGSTIVLSKAMEEAKKLHVDLLVVSGDLEGKYLLFVEQAKERIFWEDPLSGERRQGAKEDLKDVLAEIAGCGGYGVTVPKGYDPIVETKERLEEMLQEKGRNRLQEWTVKLDDFVRQSGIAVQMMPGNDDGWDFDEIIRKSNEVRFLDEESSELHGYRFVGISRVPKTPWKTPREASEKELAERLDKLCKLGNQELPLVLVAHTPPYACGLDNAPLLDENRKHVLLGGVQQTKAVGSTSLKKFLERQSNIPLALHGHVHESIGWARIGSTLCLNPGTEYFAGVMTGFLVHLKDGAVRHFEGVRV